MKIAHVCLVLLAVSVAALALSIEQEVEVELAAGVSAEQCAVLQAQADEAVKAFTKQTKAAIKAVNGANTVAKKARKNAGSDAAAEAAQAKAAAAKKAARAAAKLARENATAANKAAAEKAAKREAAAKAKAAAAKAKAAAAKKTAAEKKAKAKAARAAAKAAKDAAAKLAAGQGQVNAAKDATKKAQETAQAATDAVASATVAVQRAAEDKDAAVAKLGAAEETAKAATQTAATSTANAATAATTAKEDQTAAAQDAAAAAAKQAATDNKAKEAAVAEVAAQKAAVAAATQAASDAQAQLTQAKDEAAAAAKAVAEAQAAEAAAAQAKRIADAKAEAARKAAEAAAAAKAAADERARDPQVMRLAARAANVAARAAAALKLAQSYRPGGFNQPYNRPFSMACTSTSDDPHFNTWNGHAHDAMVWGWHTWVKSPVFTAQVYASYCGYWGGAEDTPRPPTCVKRGVFEVIIPGTEMRLVVTSDGYIKEWGTSRKVGGTYLEGRYTASAGRIASTGMTSSDPDLAIQAGVGRGWFSACIPRAGMNVGNTNGLQGFMGVDYSVAGTFRTLDGASNFLQNGVNYNQYKTNDGQWTTGGWWNGRVNGPRVMDWADQFAVGTASVPAIDLGLPEAAMQAFWSSQAFKVNFLEMAADVNAKAEVGWKFPKAKTFNVQPVEVTAEKKAFCKNLLKDIKKNYNKHYKSCIMDGEFPELAKAIVKTVKKVKVQKKTALVQLKKAVRTRQKMAEKCGITVEIPVLRVPKLALAKQFGKKSHKMAKKVAKKDKVVVKYVTKVVEKKVFVDRVVRVPSSKMSFTNDKMAFHILKAAAASSELKAQEHKEQAAQSSGKAQGQHRLKHHLFSSAAHAAHRVAALHNQPKAATKA